ncbi:MFS transporter [Lentibacter algarum]|uniref:MFS transporter n=1 Tax=Lentibacter algarum TaxID=576131 RepID=UPI001C07F836|nr:MFS transporter [Lentibacter algarum]MBU2982620.1 MFS transporter [Lentibacter algarum]
MTETNTPSAPASDSRAKRNVIILVMAQAFLGSQMPMIFTIGGLAGQSLASNICFATLPISMIVLGSMIAATPLSAFMQSHGRRAGFMLGATCGAAGAAVCAYALTIGSFPVFLLGSLLTGGYMSAQGFYRFAASDTASPAFRPKAISYVMAGGLLSAIIGPQLGNYSSFAYGAVPFVGTYLAVMALNIVGSLLFMFLDIPKPDAPAEGAPKGRSRIELLKTPAIAVSIIAAMVSYALMNLVMTSTPLAVVGCGVGGETSIPDWLIAVVPEGSARERFQFIAGYVVTAHVLAMYIPSFFTGHLIARFGTRKIVATGLMILAGAGIVGLAGVTLEHFFLALVLLGIGWNFGFIGATTMLAGSHSESERGRLQGMNDLIVFGGVFVASLASGGLMNCSGTSAQAGWTSVNLAMAPFLMLAGGALIWLAMRPKQD